MKTFLLGLSFLLFFQSVQVPKLAQAGTPEPETKPADPASVAQFDPHLGTVPITKAIQFYMQPSQWGGGCSDSLDPATYSKIKFAPEPTAEEIAQAKKEILEAKLQTIQEEEREYGAGQSNEKLHYTRIQINQLTPVLTRTRGSKLSAAIPNVTAKLRKDPKTAKKAKPERILNYDVDATFSHTQALHLKELEDESNRLNALAQSGTLNTKGSRAQFIQEVNNWIKHSLELSPIPYDDQWLFRDHEHNRLMKLLFIAERDHLARQYQNVMQEAFVASTPQQKEAILLKVAQWIVDRENTRNDLISHLSNFEFLHTPELEYFKTLMTYEQVKPSIQKMLAQNRKGKLKQIFDFFN